MRTVKDAVQEILKKYKPSPKLFWGSKKNLSLGAGMLFNDVKYPLLDIETQKFDTVQGVALVLTHECDVSQENNRGFNEDVLICPITPFEIVFDDYSQRQAPQLESFVAALAAQNISRVMYIPPVNDSVLIYGGVLQFNSICSTHISMFEGITAVAAITAMGLQNFDLKLSNHLLRPKSEMLPMTRYVSSKYY